MLSDIVILLVIAYILLLVIAVIDDIPFVLLVAGMVALLLATQAYGETQSVFVGASLGALGLITLIGGIHGAISGE